MGEGGKGGERREMTGVRKAVGGRKNRERGLGKLGEKHRKRGHVDADRSFSGVEPGSRRIMPKLVGSCLTRPSGAFVCVRACIRVQRVTALQVDKEVVTAKYSAAQDELAQARKESSAALERAARAEQEVASLGVDKERAERTTQDVRREVEEDRLELEKQRKAVEDARAESEVLRQELAHVRSLLRTLKAHVRSGSKAELPGTVAAAVAAVAQQGDVEAGVEQAASAKGSETPSPPATTRCGLMFEDEEDQAGEGSGGRATLEGLPTQDAAGGRSVCLCARKSVYTTLPRVWIGFVCARVRVCACLMCTPLCNQCQRLYDMHEVDAEVAAGARILPREGRRVEA